MFFQQKNQELEQEEYEEQLEQEPEVNQKFINWCDENIVYDENNILQIDDVFPIYRAENPTSQKHAFRRELDAYVIPRYPNQYYRLKSCVNNVKKF